MNLTNSTILEHIPPSTAEAWGYGILCTTVINLASLGGLIALPFIHGDMYKKILIFMVGLAVGTLAGSSLLFLIPEALELTEQKLDVHSHVWKCMVILSGIYAFFIIERVLKMITTYKEKRYDAKHGTGLDESNAAAAYSSFHKTADVAPYRHVDGLPHTSFGCVGSNGESFATLNEENVINEENGQIAMKKTPSDVSFQNSTNGLIQSSHQHGHKHVAPVAWMIIFGDGIHNFIDGVSIGAAFTESILAGVSVSIAIFCEELPHELGDFAVLLNAGMKMKKAVLYNFLSATVCYLGLVVGIFLGENTAAHTWVFAFAGGMFLYISLVDMMPEMNNAGETEDGKLMGGTSLFLLQNAGLLCGIGIMLLMAVYGGDLEKAIHSS